MVEAVYGGGLQELPEDLHGGLQATEALLAQLYIGFYPAHAIYRD